MYRKTYVEIDLSRLSNNVKNIINKYSQYEYYFGVVKGNAYGHGSYIINELIKCGINYLAVSSLEEAINVRKYDKNIPVLCLEPISNIYIDECIKNNVTLTINDYEYFEALLHTKFDKKVKVHLKIDSGMNRLGLNNRNEINKIYNLINNDNRIVLEGIYTHLATSGINDKEYDNQIKKFKSLLSDIDLNSIKIIHLGRSMSMITHSKINIANGIRVGISMYGINPLPVINNKGLKSKLRSIKNYLKKKKYNISNTIKECEIELEPCFHMISEVIQVKKIKENEFVGYGALYRTKKETYVATISSGYADGFRRSNTGSYVIINDKKYNIIGEIGMGMFSIECDNTIKKGDVVTLIGKGISLREVSKYNKTTIYETMCNIDKSVPRVYIKNNKIVEEITYM